MFVSRGKLYDMKLRANYLELVEICVRKGDTENAKFFGEFSKKLKERIDTHDYAEEDALYAAVDEIDKEWADLSTQVAETPPEA